MARAYPLPVALLAAALSLSCNGDLDPAWHIKTLRVFGARVDNVTRAATEPHAAEAAPGEQVRFSLSYFDPATPPRPVIAGWLLCAQLSRMGNTLGCDRSQATFLVGTDVTYTVPTIQYGVDPLGRARIQGVAVLCAGGIPGMDPVTMQPRCMGANPETAVMVRSLVVRTTEVDPINHNPEITDAVLYRSGNLTDAVTLTSDASVHIPRCTTDPCPGHILELRTTTPSREMYRTLNIGGMPVTQLERLQFGFFTTRGTMDITFYVDTAGRPVGPVRDQWQAPATAGTVTFVFSAQDTRGGFEWIQRSVTVD